VLAKFWVNKRLFNSRSPFRHTHASQNHLDCRAIALTFSLPTESLTQTDTFNQSDWLREIAIALCQQINLTTAQAAQLAQISPPELPQLLTNRAAATTESDAIDPDNEAE